MQTPDMSASQIAPAPGDVAVAQTDERRRQRRRWLVAGGTVAMSVGYPLSLGPLLFLEQQGFLPDAILPILRLIYFPIVIALNSRVPIVERFYKLYLGSLGIDL
jgi:hypothetical protein